jgi:uncharacterized protein YqgQ
MKELQKLIDKLEEALKEEQLLRENGILNTYQRLDDIEYIKAEIRGQLESL